MAKRKIKIVIAIGGAFIIALALSNTFFSFSSPRTNRTFIASLPKRIAFFFASRLPTPTPRSFAIMTSTPVPITIQISPLPPKISPTKIPITAIPTSLPTTQVTKIPTPTLKPTIKPTVLPASCPTTSSQSYSTMGTEHNPSDLLIGLADQSPEINLRLRGFTEVNEGTGFVGRHGDKYGLDDQMPPQISSLYGGTSPQIVKTYRIYDWDFDNKKSLVPQTATPNFKVHMIGLAATPGQPLLGLKAGRSIGGENVFMVLYATKTDIVFTHSNSDTLLGGYLFFFLDICVDPNLLAAYQSADAAGRGSLPVIATGQVFGYAGNTDVKVSIRDSMSFMDERYNEDWWTYGQ